MEHDHTHELSDDTREFVRDLVSGVEAALSGTGAPAEDAAGVHVGSITEALMGNTAALVQIAHALNDVASAIQSCADKLPTPK